MNFDLWWYELTIFKIDICVDDIDWLIFLRFRFFFRILNEHIWKIDSSLWVNSCIRSTSSTTQRWSSWTIRRTIFYKFRQNVVDRRTIVEKILIIDTLSNRRCMFSKVFSFLTVTISIWQHILLNAKCLTFWQRHRVLLIIFETYVISCFIDSIFVNYNIYYSSFFKFLTQYYLFELLAIAAIINKSKFFRRFSRWWCSNDFNVQYYIVEFANLLFEIDHQFYRLRTVLRLKKIQRDRLHRRMTIETIRRWKKYKIFV